MTLNDIIAQLTELQQQLGGGAKVHVFGIDDFIIQPSAQRVLINPAEEPKGHLAVKECMSALEEAEQAIKEAEQAIKEAIEEIKAHPAIGAAKSSTELHPI